MAIIAFVDISKAKGMHGRGDDLYLRGGRIVRRVRHRSPAPFKSHPSIERFLRSDKRSDTNSLFCQIASHFFGLSNPDKSSWADYAFVSEKYSSSDIAFTSLNMRAIYPSHPCLGWVNNITLPVQTPNIPSRLCVFYMGGSNSLSITWDYPNLVDLVFQCFFKVWPGLKRSTIISPLYFSTAYALDNSLLFPLSSFDSGRQISFLFRALNTRGEVGSFSTPITYTV